MQVIAPTAGAHNFTGYFAPRDSAFYTGVDVAACVGAMSQLATFMGSGATGAMLRRRRLVPA